MHLDIVKAFKDNFVIYQDHFQQFIRVYNNNCYFKFY